ncbi:hypothetical protein SPI_05747 [Niveomyces insectorum RCEF 264]|uniref:Uncharacterized protein n=1 Tax=Niveomyces insectorum RCEF 264 TaxID=1081102 RepID=A0A167SEH8_9HYPO|nr:hypothetical protein SPI_05747 [Niveomyces insectorum RCEF 264]
MVPDGDASLAHQRGRRRRRSPPPPPGTVSSVPVAAVPAAPLSLMHTATAMAAVTKQRPPVGSPGTFRGRRRYRSPSVSPSARSSPSSSPAALPLSPPLSPPPSPPQLHRYDRSQPQPPQPLHAHRLALSGPRSIHGQLHPTTSPTKRRRRGHCPSRRARSRGWPATGGGGGKPNPKYLAPTQDKEPGRAQQLASDLAEGIPTIPQTPRRRRTRSRPRPPPAKESAPSGRLRAV